HEPELRRIRAQAGVSFQRIERALLYRSLRMAEQGWRKADGVRHLVRRAARLQRCRQTPVQTERMDARVRGAEASSVSVWLGALFESLPRESDGRRSGRTAA